MSLSDSQTGMPVTLVVQPGTVAPPPPGQHGHVPFTGFDLAAAVLLAVLLLVLGGLLLAGSVLPRLVPSRVSTTHSRRRT
jgi:hypothetical protein